MNMALMRWWCVPRLYIDVSNTDVLPTMQCGRFHDDVYHVTRRRAKKPLHHS